MKKTTRKFAAFIAAMTLTACTMAPMSMVSYAAGNASVTITGIGAVEHEFEIYQIFTGDYDAVNDTFSALKWGTGVSKFDGNDVTPGNLVDSTIIDSLGTDANAILKRITTGAKACDNEKAADEVKFEGLDDGYYIIKDITAINNEDDANSAYIVQVAAEANSPSITIKNETPTVKKYIQDETADAEAGADAEGWGESADHAINESFKFKLVATIPENEDDLAAYETYKVVFNDTMHSGVTYEGIESVKITSNSVNMTLDSTQYTTSGTDADNKAGITWTLTIDDVKALVNANDADIFGKEEITIEVIYNAHLNEKAIVDEASRTGGTSANTNNNMVYLQYSNNPDGTGTGDGLGQTEKDYVWAFTYELNNVKYEISQAAGNELGGAKFELRIGETAIKLIDNGDGTYTVADQNATDGYVTTMTSAEGTGKFDVIGLDAGTYTLVETDAPEGYNEAPAKTFTIGATHAETTSKTAVDLTLTGLDDGVENPVVNTKNNSLPSTGGIGTTLFVVGGSCLVALSGVYLISKKRTKEESAE